MTNAGMTERWCDIPGFEEIYRVSTRGRVRSLPRIDASGNRRRGTVLRPLGGGGHRQRRYYKLCRNGKSTMYCASVLMALAQGIPNPRRCGYVVHVDGDYDNFQRSNLRWVTLAEQRLHDARKADTPYYGVIRNKRSAAGAYRWILQLRHGKRRLIWRCYATPEEAAYAWNQEVRRRGLKRPLNDVRRPRAFKPTEVKSLPGEIWRPFPGTRGTHMISSRGRVRTLAFVSSHGQRISPRLRRISVNASGYASVLIRGRRYGIRKVLARAFGRNAPAVL